MQSLGSPLVKKIRTSAACSENLDRSELLRRMAFDEMKSAQLIGQGEEREVRKSQLKRTQEVEDRLHRVKFFKEIKKMKLGSFKIPNLRFLRESKWGSTIDYLLQHSPFDENFDIGYYTSLGFNGNERHSKLNKLASIRIVIAKIEFDLQENSY